jgi:hypothetical protein
VSDEHIVVMVHMYLSVANLTTLMLEVDLAVSDEARNLSDALVMHGPMVSPMRAPTMR